jgi:hypothetical protein
MPIRCNSSGDIFIVTGSAMFISLLLIAILAVPVTAASDPAEDCTLVDQFGNKVCGSFGQAAGGMVPEDLRAPSAPVYPPVFSAIAGKFPAVSTYFSTFFETAAKGIRGSLNQTISAKNNPDLSSDAPDTGTEGSGGGNVTGFNGISRSIYRNTVQLFNVSGRGVNGSINQTLNADKYINFYADKNPENESASELPKVRGLTSIPRALLTDLFQFQNITLYAIQRSFRNATAEGGLSSYPNRDTAKPLPGDLVPEDRYYSGIAIPIVSSNPATVIIPLMNQSTPVNPVVPEVTIPKVFETPPKPVYNLSVESYPSEALVVINGNRSGMTPTSISLEQGNYTLSLFRANYQKYEQNIVFNNDTNLSIPLTSTLETRFVKPGQVTAQTRHGGVYITTFPDQLELQLDGISITGASPFLYYGLPEGTHTITVIKPAKTGPAQVFTRSVYVYHDAITKININTEDTHVIKTVSISAGPYSGAEFTINGAYPPGRLPATVRVAVPGTFIVVHKGDEYNSHMIQPTALEVEHLEIGKETDPHAPLEITSLPEGAEIFIDGFRTGKKTPSTFSQVSAGIHKIGVSKLGYYPADDLVTVPIAANDSAPQKVSFALENYGESTLVVDSLPPGSSIYLNGWSTGETTPHTFDHLKIGFYEIVVNGGKKPWIDQLELTPDKVFKIVADFTI